MAQGGGKPGYTIKAIVTADQTTETIIVVPREADADLWEYFSEAGTDEFVVQFLHSHGEHHPGGDNEQKDS